MYMEAKKDTKRTSLEELDYSSFCKINYRLTIKSDVTRHDFQ